MTDSRGTEPDRILRCVECGTYLVGLSTDTDELVPAGGRCSECGGDEFEQVVFDSHRG
jgi:hypothetical protein